MEYNTLEISAEKIDMDIGYVQALARVKVGGRVFKKRYTGPAKGLREVLLHPINEETSDNFLGKIKTVYLKFPKNKRGGKFMHYTLEYLLRPDFPFNSF